jgi:chemotaxis protein MotB
MKQYNNLKDELLNLEDIQATIVEDSRVIKEQNTEVKAECVRLKGDSFNFNNKLNICSEEKRYLESELANMKRTYGDYPNMSSTKSKEISNLLEKVRKANLELIEREKKLNESEKIRKEEQKRLIELEGILKKKDAAVAELKSKVSDALLGFEKDGLSIHIKNGKVYVSVEDKLLFRSGSWIVGTNGKKALDKLSNVIAKNLDINIMVEGHTDNIPYKGNTQITDNWDLSVKRSTAIIRIILENKDVSPSRLVAAGRSKYMPLDTANTKIARAKNRRTEIILTPKLDEVFKILEN